MKTLFCLLLIAASSAFAQPSPVRIFVNGTNVPVNARFTNSPTVTVNYNNTNISFTSSGSGSATNTNTFNADQFTLLLGTNVNISSGALVTNLSANGITNRSLTADALVASDANKKEISVTIGSGLSYSGGTLSALASTNNASYAAISTTLNTVLTNGTNVGYASVSAVLTSTVTELARVVLYVESAGGSGVFQIAPSAQIGAAIAMSDHIPVGGFIPPNSRYYFTNLSVGSATASILADSAWLVTLTGGLSGSSAITNFNAMSANGGAFSNGVTMYGTLTGSNATFHSLVASNAFTQKRQWITMDGSNVVVNPALGNDFGVVLTGPGFLLVSNTLAGGTNDSWTFTLDVLQDSTGARTLHSPSTNVWYTNSPTATNLTSLLNTNAGGMSLISGKNSSRTNGQFNVVIQAL